LEGGKPWVLRGQDRQAAKGRTNFSPVRTIDLDCLHIPFICARTPIIFNCSSSGIIEKADLSKIAFQEETTLKQGKGCYSTRCIICGAEIAEDQSCHLDAMFGLCSNCRYRSAGATELFASSLERFLIGNVL